MCLPCGPVPTTSSSKKSGHYVVRMKRRVFRTVGGFTLRLARSIQYRISLVSSWWSYCSCSDDNRQQEREFSKNHSMTPVSGMSGRNFLRGLPR
ncbi:hypothetical protein VFPPC_15999 [Pochonia chlamydosporia 170]|uniref:Uncharacterized protein n=1 Tax=Pochonia chlamydosporia 170 TaxID=1380566 RepID=A0A179FKT5_METCM|nr:hypothetical protein VFPPC_15999 [Pochonia chlamydosporia 170]OAQ66246.1 hypothetical protein VFPPC_15999 [Pochonia chlamydosporia 170]